MGLLGLIDDGTYVGTYFGISMLAGGVYTIAGQVDIQMDNVPSSIPHIKAGTDADAVFGMVYAQAEDDFNRIETNFLNSQGRLAEAEGESAIWRDLRMKLFIHPDTMRAL